MASNANAPATGGSDLPAANSSAFSSRHRSIQFLALASLLLAQAGLLVWHIRYASVTTDEFGHLPLALHYVVTGDPEYLLMNPPSGPALAALAQLVGAPDVDLNFSRPRVVEAGAPPDTFFWTMGGWFEFRNSQNYDRIYMRSRLVIAGLTLVLSFIAYGFARMLAGPRAGLVTLALFAFSPDFLAHGSLVTTDLAAAFAALFFAFAFFLYTRRRDWRLLPLPGLSIALLLLAKHSCLIFLPLAPVFLWFGPERLDPAAVPRPSRRLGRLAAELAAVAVIGWLIAAAPYLHGSQYEQTSFFHQAVAEKPMTALHRLTFALTWPMPEPWREALKLQLHDAERPWPTYLLGRLRLAPSIWYYPVAFFFKTPLALILLSLGAVAFAAGRLARPRDPAVAAALFWAGQPAAYFYLLLCLLPGKQYGIRLALPGLGLLLVFIGTILGRWVDGRSCTGAVRSSDELKLIKKRIVLISALIAWYIFDTLLASPHFLGYFNELAGGPRPNHHGLRYLADSNLDWGQDWKALARWQAEHHPGPLALARSGPPGPDVFGVKYEELACPLPSGVIAVSANLLVGIDPFRPSRPCLLPLRDRPPDDRIGTSIFIYRLP